MIHLNLFATLLRSINWNSVQRLILVGDPNQLPPIGRGKVFSDTIAWLNDEYPDNVGVLTENIRQLVNRVEGNGCGILDLAELFIQEKQSDMSDSTAADELKRKKEELFTRIMENGNGDVDKDLAVYFWKEQEDLATLSEYFVRSKSEVIIANMLVSEEVPFVYEEPLYAPDGTMFLPDFTVKFRGETYYWEHVGRLDLPDYRAHWEIKEKWYEKHFPGKLLTTYEGKDLSIDAMTIIKEHK